MDPDEFKHDPKAEEWVDPYPKKKSRIGWVVTPALVIIVYFLSFGPIYTLAFKGILPRDAVDIFYKPLEKLAGYSSAVDKLVGWYLSYWLPPQTSPPPPEK